MRKFHRSFGMMFGLFLFLTAVTGLLWAYAPYLYWKPGYMMKKAASPSPPLSQAALSFSEAVDILEEREGREMEVQSILLRKGFGRLLYEIEYDVTGEKRRCLIDAQTGDFLSPLTEQLAIQVARQYVRGDTRLESVDLLPNWVHRKKTHGVPAFRIRFRDVERTEIFLDPQTGHILEDQDRARRFHFLVMRLHQLNFFGFRKVLTIVPGLTLLSMIVTGACLWIGPQIKRRRLRREKEIQKPLEEEISESKSVLPRDGRRKRGKVSGTPAKG